MTVDAASVGLLAGLAAAPLCWYGIVKRRRAMGRSAVLAHVVGLATSPLVLMAVFSMFYAPSLMSVIFFAIVFLPLAFFVRRRAPEEVHVIASADSAVAAPPPNPPEIDIEAVEATRQQSLDAMRRSTKAREAGKQAESQRGNPIGDPLANWKRTAPAKPMKRARVAPVPKIKGQKLDVVRFDYINSEGAYSRRRVVVRQVAEAYFEGVDTDIGETRTFRYDRVVGCLTSELSGEVALPEEWADGIRARLAH